MKTQTNKTQHYLEREMLEKRDGLGKEGSAN